MHSRHTPTPPVKMARVLTAYPPGVAHAVPIRTDASMPRWPGNQTSPEKWHPLTYTPPGYNFDA